MCLWPSGRIYRWRAWEPAATAVAAKNSWLRTHARSPEKAASKQIKTGSPHMDRGAPRLALKVEHMPCVLLRTFPPASIDAQFTRSYSLTTALAPFTLRVWLTICLWAALFV